MGFDTVAGTFTFIDRDELKLGHHENLYNMLAKFFILCGSYYTINSLASPRSLDDLFQELETACNRQTQNEYRKQLLQPTNFDERGIFYDTKGVVFD